MAYNSYSSNGLAGRQSSHNLNHKVSNLSDTSYDESTGAVLRGRESLVSLQSHHDSPPLGALPEEHTYDHDNSYRGSWSSPLTGQSAGGRYQPVSSSAAGSRSSFGGRFKSFRTRAQDTIREDESIDMSLLRSAAPVGQSASYEPVSKKDDEQSGLGFDITSFAGPMMEACDGDNEMLKSLQEQEASGKLTGGLGQGESRGMVIRGEHLLSATPRAPSLRRTLTKSLSMRRSPTTGSKAEWRDLGQDEANKRGEVIEVIIEEPTDVDLSSMVGPSPGGFDTNKIRHSVIPAQMQPKTQVFYPQPDWKPFSMRWPYLTFMIFLSLFLGICQEVLYQKGGEHPLISFKNASQVGPGYYFVFKFVPTIIAVMYGVLWQNIDFEVKRLEAFYQMSKEGGALAAESINVDYITLFNFTRPFLALQRKHYAVAVSSVTTLLAVSLVPTFGSAVLVLNPSRVERQAHPDFEKTILVNATLSRLLTSTFFIIAILGCLLFYQLNTRRSGLLSDVRGIAGVASMAVVSHIMMDFKDMDIAKPKNIHNKLKYRRYVLRNSSLAPDDLSTVSTREGDRYKDAHLSENPHPLMLRMEGCIPFLVGIFLFLIFVPIFLFTGASALTENAPWVITLLAVCIKLAWGSLDTSMRMMEPYYRLSKRHAPARTLTLDYTAMPFAVVAAQALLNRHWLMFLVGWGSVMVEGLTIFATSLATVEGKDFVDAVNGAVDDDNESLNEGVGSGSETVRSFFVTLALTVFILGYLFVVAGVVFYKRHHPFLPRQPNTIASVLAFMHQSKMLYDFVGTAKFTNSQMRTKLDEIGKTYGLGWFRGRDGQTHCGVDEEELTGNYKHGIDYSKGNNPWTTEWQLF